MGDPEEDIFMSDLPSASSIETAKEFQSLISSETEEQPEISLVVMRDNGERQELYLSPVAQRAIIDMFHIIAAGRPFQISAVDEELTVEQAAALLRFPANHFETLVKAGRIPFYEKDGQKVFRKTDLVAFQEERRSKMSEGMERLTAMDADLLDIEEGCQSNPPAQTD